MKVYFILLFLLGISKINNTLLLLLRSIYISSMIKLREVTSKSISKKKTYVA